MRERGQVLYELHVGTFTPAGTYTAAEEQLGHLAELGVTTLELMPLADFPGDFGWGYDGVLLWAPTRLYGSPDELRRFVDRAHHAGLAVIALRRHESALSVGTYKPIVAAGQLIAYLREAGEQRFLIALNLGSRPAHLSLQELGEGQIVIGTDARRDGEAVSGRLVLLGDDGVVVRLRPANA